MATDKTFRVVGVSKHEGEYKVRFANDIMRIKVLAKHGHEDIRLAELPEALSKMEAVLAIKELTEYQDPSARSCINEWIDGNRPKTAKIKAVVETDTDEGEVETAVTETEDEDTPF